MYAVAVFLGLLVGQTLVLTNYWSNVPWNQYTTSQKDTFKAAVIAYMEEHDRYDAPSIGQAWDKIYDSGNWICEQVAVYPRNKVISEGVQAAKLMDPPLSEKEARFRMVMLIDSATRAGSLCP